MFLLNLMENIKATFVCLAFSTGGGYQNLKLEKKSHLVVGGKIYILRTLTKPHKSRMGAVGALAVQPYMKR